MTSPSPHVLVHVHSRGPDLLFVFPVREPQESLTHFALRALLSIRSQGPIQFLTSDGIERVEGGRPVDSLFPLGTLHLHLAPSPSSFDPPRRT